MDESTVTVNVDTTTSRQLCEKLLDQAGVHDGFGYAVYIAMYGKVSVKLYVNNISLTIAYRHSAIHYSQIIYGELVENSACVLLTGHAVL